MSSSVEVRGNLMARAGRPSFLLVGAILQYPARVV
jgi:hypothetical protein